MNQVDFNTVLNDGAISVLSRRAVLGPWADRRLGPYDWRTDFDTGLAAFIAREGGGRIDFGWPQALVSIAPGPGTILWSWAQPRSPRSLAAVNRLREFGQHYGIPQLTEPEVPFDRLVRDPGSYDSEDAMLMDIAHRVAIVAGQVTDLPQYVIAAQGQSKSVLLPPSSQVPLPTMRGFREAIDLALNAGYITNVRRSLESAIQRLGFSADWRGDGRQVRIEGAGKSIELEFDEFGRVTTIRFAVDGEGILRDTE